MAFVLASDTKRLVCLAILLGVYLLSGAAVFQVLENENENKDVVNLNSLRMTFCKKYNISTEDFELLVGKVERATKYRCGGPPESWCMSRWSYYASLYFTWSVVTTIGYGHLAPSTLGGRIFCMIFALFGIPLNLMILKNLGDRIKDVIHYVHFLLATRVMKREGEYLTTYTLPWTLGFMFAMLVIGAILYAQTEHWNYFDGIYFCFITFSTIGFGDLVPNQGGPPCTVIEVVKETFRALVIILGLSMFFSVISSIMSASEELRITFPLSKRSAGKDSGVTADKKDDSIAGASEACRNGSCETQSDFNISTEEGETTDVEKNKNVDLTMRYEGQDGLCKHCDLDEVNMRGNEGTEITHCCIESDKEAIQGDETNTKTSVDIGATTGK
ncbi:potassium channel subfamily K member 15 [Nematostella vectensis]|uniref:potassium channel subfamily K member 15 n=1 Tax=Nematostella vectensis TaxID=45351 RepID=UPI0020776C2C|nr:potassium channel subfamily K member 15 [Nematostella vectensis]